MDQKAIFLVYFFERNNDENKALSLQTERVKWGDIASV